MTGSLQIKNDTYFIVLNIKNTNGKRRQKWISTGLASKGNKRRAEQRLTELLAEYENSGYIEPSKILLCDFVREWVDIRGSHLQPTTHSVYLHMLDKHIYPYFSKSGVMLKDITPILIQKYHNAKLKNGLSPNSVIKHHAVLRSALQYAVKVKLIKENPCDMVDKLTNRNVKSTRAISITRMKLESSYQSRKALLLRYRSPSPHTLVCAVQKLSAYAGALWIYRAACCRFVTKL
jgi:Site-specific recombinase XerD